jgi:methionyl-tRNA formyltransferase
VRIAFLTADDPLYLPDFFRRVLSERASDTVAVYRVPPLYRDQSASAAALRYLQTFGWAATLQLGRRLLAARLARRSIARVCGDFSVHCRTVPDVNAPAFLDELRDRSPDLLVSVSCPQIFRRPLIAVPTMGVLNIHGSPLPAYRGILPAFWMLANGESQAGVTVFLVDEGVDTGEVCGQRLFAIEPEESLDQFLRRSKAIAADLLLEVIAAFETRTMSPTALDVSRGSYYSWPNREAVARFRAAGRRLW